MVIDYINETAVKLTGGASGLLVSFEGDKINLISSYCPLKEFELISQFISELKNSGKVNLINTDSLAELNSYEEINKLFPAAAAYFKKISLHLDDAEVYCLILFSDKEITVSSEKENVLNSLLNSLAEYLKEKPEYIRKGDSHPNSLGEHLKNTTKYLEAIIFSSSPDGKSYNFVTDGVEKILGCKASEVVANPSRFLRYIAREDFSKFKHFVEKIKKGETSTVEYKITNLTGEERYLRHTAFPIYKNEEMIRVDGIIYDVTNEKKNQMLLEQSEERFRTLVETAEDLIFTLDNYGNFLSVNSYGAMSIDYTPEEIVGKHFMDFIVENEKHSVTTAFREILKTNKVVTFETTILTKLGRECIFEINCRTTKHEGEIVGMLGIGRNITERRMNEAQLSDLNAQLKEANRLISIERDRANQQVSVLEELNRLKSDFVSGISHELRTPLASIIGFSETIESDPNMPQEMKSEFNKIILTEGKRLAKLVNDVLDISKIESGKISLSKSEFDLIKLLRETADLYKILADKKNVTLTYQLPDEEINIYGDKDRIAQVFANLIHNAIKFTKSGGRVAVITKSFYRELEVIISDTGIGIPAKDIPFIFQKFYKVSRPDSEVSGTGLGLVLVKQIIDLHKGLITVQSEVDKGTTFVVKLPKSLKKHKELL